MQNARVARRLFRFGRMHSEQRDARAVRFHYDVGNDFYALWLDPQMVYSCAYFEDGVESLDVAQTAKLDYVCRKLRLTRGERLLDIGCGWGALVIHAARHYGVRAVKGWRAASASIVGSSGLTTRASHTVTETPSATSRSAAASAASSILPTTMMQRSSPWRSWRAVQPVADVARAAPGGPWSSASGSRPARR